MMYVLIKQKEKFLPIRGDFVCMCTVALELC